ncbi:MAG: hypothetical protein WC107_06285 [Patescibacteria group bacterium]
MSAGAISLAEENFRTMLADSAKFRTLVGATAGTEAQKHAAALARIYREGLPPPTDKKEYTRTELEALRPCAIVFADEMDHITLERDSSDGFAAAGSLTMMLFRTCPADQVLGNDRPSAAADQEWSDIVGVVQYELATLSNTAGYLSFHRIRAGTFNVPSGDVPAQGVWQGALYRIQWRGV